MNHGELTKESRENALLNLYQNQGYQTERVERKSMILDIESGKATSFTINLQEPLRIDKLSDMYLDSFTTVNCLQGSSLAPTGLSAAGFILKLNQFNIHTASGSTDNITGSNLFNSVFIPNESTGEPDKTVCHKSKKFNYICNVNPTKIYTISGSVTDLSGNSPFTGTGRIIAEFVFISRD